MAWQDYEPIQVLGKGAAGYVMLCRHKRRDQRLVVIKELYDFPSSWSYYKPGNRKDPHHNSGKLTDLSSVKRTTLLAEISALSILRHPNIISYLDSFVHAPLFQMQTIQSNRAPIPTESPSQVPSDACQRFIEAHRTLISPSVAHETLFIVMEYADQGSLQSLIASRTLLPHEMLLFFAQLVLSLQHIHAHTILHRDLKPSNILLTQSRAGPLMLKIGDFGISQVPQSRLTADKDSVAQDAAISVFGTPAYLAPELCRGQEHSEKTDIWALGCILYEMAMQKPMFGGASLPQIVRNILEVQYDRSFSATCPSIVIELIEWCTSEEAVARPTALDLLCHPMVQGYYLAASCVGLS